MNNNGIEDILIGNNDKTSKKKGKTGIIIFVLLLLILLGLGAAYLYFSYTKVSYKEEFFNNLSNTNIGKIVNTEIYNNLCNRILNENSEATTSVNFSTTLEDENLKDIDTSKFLIDLTSKNNVNEEKFSTEFGINYSGNKIFNVKMLADKEKIAAFSDEVVDKYVCFNYPLVKEVFGIDVNKESLTRIRDAQKINITDEEKQNYINKYMQDILTLLPEEKFSSQDNIVINKNAESLNVTSYALSLSKDELKNILVNTLTNLKNDKELLNKLVSETSINSEDNSSTNNRVINAQIVVPNDEENTVTEQQPEENLDQELEATQTIDLNPTSTNFNDSTKDTKKLFNEKYENLAKIILGRKIDTTVQELQKNIDNLIEKINNLNDGLTINVYVSAYGTEKINIVLPSTDTVDFEFTKKNDEENIVKLTYLYKENSSIFSLFKNEEVETYSADDDILKDETNENSKSNGFSLTINRIQKDTNTAIKATYSFIENEEINKKINIDLKTEGTANSKNLSNNFIITVSTKDGENTATIDNNIKFSDVPEIEELTDENCLFLDNLEPEERNNTIKVITDKVKSLYEDKKKNLNFIDTNTHGSVVEQNLDNLSSNVTRDEAREALINRVSTMMGEAIERNEEFTIQNLVDLTIDGYNVSSVVSETSAVIIVDIYTFNIDTEFQLTDVE